MISKLETIIAVVEDESDRGIAKKPPAYPVSRPGQGGGERAQARAALKLPSSTGSQDRRQ
jgi:hypothetical protein